MRREKSGLTRSQHRRAGGRESPARLYFQSSPPSPRRAVGTPSRACPCPARDTTCARPAPPHLSPRESSALAAQWERGEPYPPLPRTCVSWGPRPRRVKRSAYLEVSGKPLPASPPQLGFLAPCHLGPPPCIDILFVFLSALHSKNNCLSPSLFPRLFMMWTMTRRSLLFRSPGGL